MKILIFGADGFVGRNVYNAVQNDKSLEAISASRSGSSDYAIDLLDRKSIQLVLEAVKPTVIVNCAGIVVNSSDAFNNVEFCRNIFEAVIASKASYKKIIITGSAAEYGVVDDIGRPVKEDDPLRATNDYGTSKIQEVVLAEDYAEKYGLDVTVARIFNPIGPGMAQKFLLTNLLSQIREIQQGKAETITVSRLDSMRDYIDVRDVASAILAFITEDTGKHHIVQNIGSGKATSTKGLIDGILKQVDLDVEPTIIEAQGTPEPSYAAIADISRITAEFGWTPHYELKTTIEDIIHEQI